MVAKTRIRSAAIPPSTDLMNIFLTEDSFVKRRASRRFSLRTDSFNLGIATGLEVLAFGLNEGLNFELRALDLPTTEGLDVETFFLGGSNLAL
jgi:hypothetical protein